MKLDDQRESDNVEDRRGMPGGVGGSIGIGTVALALVAWYFGIDPSTVIDASQAIQATQHQSAPAPRDGPHDKGRVFVGKVLASTEDAWAQVFQKSGGAYRKPVLVLFSDSTQTACGAGRSATGPFYCPADEKLYIDLTFFDELAKRFRAPGQFAEAYVIAHEVGHHVQKVTGISGKFEQLRQRASPEQANRLSVRLELQADCYAGVWGHYARDFRGIVEPGEVEQALKAASAIGDDRLQRESQGRVVPESFTHGTSEQRVRWFKRGMDGGDPGSCDNFRTREL